jgi:hypothetical protein
MNQTIHFRGSNATPRGFQRITNIDISRPLLERRSARSELFLGPELGDSTEHFNEALTG